MKRLSYTTKISILIILTLLVIVSFILLISTMKTLNKHYYLQSISNPQKDTDPTIKNKFTLVEQETYYVQKNLPAFDHPALEEQLEAVASQFEQTFKQAIQPKPQDDYRKFPILTIHYKLDKIDNQHYNVILLASHQQQELAVWAKVIDIENGKILLAQDILFEKTPDLTAYLYKNHFELLDIPVNTLFENFHLTQDIVTLYSNSLTFSKLEFPMDKLKPSFRLLVSENGLVANEQTERENPLVQSDRKLVAFTFDDGPTPNLDKQIIEKFKVYNGKATFFMLGNRVEQFPETVDFIRENGHEIANHSYSHADLADLTADQINHEINYTSELLGLKNKPVLIRPPYGSVNQHVLDTIYHPLINWNVDSTDWRLGNKHKIAKQILENVHNGAIVLMHDLYQESVDALDIVLPKLAALGYEFVTVSELFEANNELLLPHEVYYGISSDY